FADQDFSDAPFAMPTVEPRRTFLEKAFLLHEEFLREPGQIRVHRMSRHLYDLEKLMDTEHGTQALADLELYQEIVAHRSRFYRRGHVNYDQLSHAHIDFVPPDQVIQALQNDYQDMSESMFIGNVLPFDDLMQRLN